MHKPPAVAQAMPSEASLLAAQRRTNVHINEPIATFMSTPQPIRIVLAKLGLDGHDRGIQVVARALRDAGMEVIYTGLWQSPDAVIRAVEDEDADVLGVSILSGAHMTIMPHLIEKMRTAGLTDVKVMVGGIIPETDIPALEQAGVHRVFTPGTSLKEITDFVQSANLRE